MRATERVKHIDWLSSRGEYYACDNGTIFQRIGSELIVLEEEFGVDSRKLGKKPKIKIGSRYYSVPHLICQAFHGPKPFKGACCCHEDDDPRNNCKANLRWDTRAANTKEAHRNNKIHLRK